MLHGVGAATPIDSVQLVTVRNKFAGKKPVSLMKFEPAPVIPETLTVSDVTVGTMPLEAHPLSVKP